MSAWEVAVDTAQGDCRAMVMASISPATEAHSILLHCGNSRFGAGVDKTLNAARIAARPHSVRAVHKQLS